MKKALVILASGFVFLSCENSNQTSFEDVQKQIEKSTSKFIQSNPEEAISSLQFIILKENRYYIDEDEARKAGINEKILKKLKIDISDVNNALDEREKFIIENKQNIKEYEIELIDFQKLNIDSLKQKYHSDNNSITRMSGDLSTSDQYPRTATVFNPNYTKVEFRGQRKTAIISFHTFGASSSLGGWQYKDGTGSFSIPITREISLYSNNDNLRLSYKITDPEGGTCGLHS